MLWQKRQKGKPGCDAVGWNINVSEIRSWVRLHHPACVGSTTSSVSQLGDSQDLVSHCLPIASFFGWLSNPPWADCKSDWLVLRSMCQTFIVVVESCKLWRRFHASLFRRLRHYFQSMLCTGTCSALDFRGPALVFPPTNGLEAVSAFELFHVFFWLEYGVFSLSFAKPFRDCFCCQGFIHFLACDNLAYKWLLGFK